MAQTMERWRWTAAGQRSDCPLTYGLRGRAGGTRTRDPGIMSPAAVATGVYFSLWESVSRPVQTTLPTLFDSIWPHEWPHAEVIRALNCTVLSHS
jgi:hypothetical protein